MHRRVRVTVTVVAGHSLSEIAELHARAFELVGAGTAQSEVL